jgi:hypothetical protein
MQLPDVELQWHFQFNPGLWLPSALHGCPEVVCEDNRARMYVLAGSVPMQPEHTPL